MLPNTHPSPHMEYCPTELPHKTNLLPWPLPTSCLFSASHQSTGITEHQVISFLYFTHFIFTYAHVIISTFYC